MRTFHVYILASRTGTLYIGVTSDLARRLQDHKQHLVPGFTARYDVKRLVWYEAFADPVTAIEREKQLKRWRRAKKVQLVEAANPEWNDLAAGAGP